MEVPYEREGKMDLLQDHTSSDTITTTTTSIKNNINNTYKPLSPTSSDSSTNSSCVFNDNNFEYFGHELSANNLHVQELSPANASNVTPNQETNGFSVHQNGTTLVHPILKTNDVDNAVDVGSIASTFSNTPDTAVGLKYVDTLLDDTSSAVISTDTYNAQNGIVSPNQNAGALQPDQDQPEVEYDVERVLQKQETHDLYCPNCRSCITKRVILLRRKRKIHEISTAQDVSGSEPDQTALPADSDCIPGESQEPSLVGGPPDSRLDAISCFSCFSIFVPSGEGFLCWRFKPKADLSRQPETFSNAGQTVDSKTDNTGTSFPLWVVSCCQPAERKRSDYVDEAAATLGSMYGPLSGDGTTASSNQTEPPFPPSDDVSISSTLGTFLPAHSTGRPHIEGPQYGAGTPLQNKPLNPIKPYGDDPSCETSSTVTTDEDETAPSQEAPSATSSNISDHPDKPDGTMLPRESSSAPSGGTKSDFLAISDGTVPQMESPSLSELSGGTMPPVTPSDDNPIPSFKPEYPAIFVPGTSSPFKPITTSKPVNDIHGPPQTESPAGSGNAVLPMPPKPQPPVLPLDAHGGELSVDVEAGLARELSRPGVSGLDIVKAIVYGGLLESITSLSVITSAAGGDATTLNIVALGLANVFGGLVVLVHNLRALKHEHATEHYEAQLGRPGHYMLHAVVAIISYLVFGLMSPIIYGFSFRKSDNKDYKLATLAATAIACIALLSAAKAYVRNPPKGYIKTVFYYISLGFMVSGLGYVAGDTINMLLKKLGVFDPRAPSDVPVLAAGVMNAGWSYY
ncbi:hypothetical protein KSS87_023674 [Heliosperma pusillum]|nr:hypothetical protein KSS87_023674 [Heliosperma pusillum]